jgi:MFS family permease
MVYGVSFLIYRFGVADRDREERAMAATARKTSERTGWQRYRSIITNEYVLLLAPTWIAVNASIGIWFSQSLFQFSKADPRFPDQFMLQGFSPIQISIAAVVIGLIFGAGLLWWGNRFKTLRRTTIIFYGILGGGVMAFGVLAINHAAPDVLIVAAIGALAGAIGLFVLAGATPAALGLLADISERFPSDRGAIMGLYSVFLGIGQIVGSLIGGAAANWLGIDGLLFATVVLLLVALVPLAFLRREEHEVSGPESAPAFGGVEPTP